MLNGRQVQNLYKFASMFITTPIAIARIVDPIFIDND